MNLSRITILALCSTFVGAGVLFADMPKDRVEPECTSDIIAVALGDCPSTSEGIRLDCQGRIPTGCTALAPPESTCTEKVSGYTLYCKVATEL